MKNLWILMVLMGSWALAASLEEVVVPSHPIKTPVFVDGATLGTGVVEKEFVAPPKNQALASKVIKVKRQKLVALKNEKAPARSIASYSEDTKFSNDVIAKVREKDAADREETLNIVRGAIERGEFGAAAKAKLENQK